MTTLEVSRALESLERATLKMAELTEVQLEAAVAALTRRDAILAEEVVRGDDEVDRWDVRLEVEALRVLHRHQLLEGEFRFVVAVVKVDTQLERIGDLAVNIAERALSLSSRPPLPAVDDFDRMATRVQRMVGDSVRALATRDVALARQVLDLDREVDEVHRELFELYEELMRQDASAIERAVEMLSCSKYLERVGDHAKNIAEDVVYIVEGEIIRHPGRNVPAAAAALATSEDE